MTPPQTEPPLKEEEEEEVVEEKRGGEFVTSVEEMTEVFNLNKVPKLKGIGFTEYKFDPAKAKFEGFSKKFPHPIKNKIEGLDYDTQLKLWHRLSFEGRKRFSEMNYSPERKEKGGYFDYDTMDFKKLPADRIKKGTMESVGAGKRRQPKILDPIIGKSGSDIDYWRGNLIEKYGILGLMPDTLLANITGLDEKVEKKLIAKLRGEGLAGLGMYKGYKLGKPLGPKGKAVGAGVGSAIGFIIGQTVGQMSLGRVPTPAETAKGIVYSMMGLPPAARTAATAVRQAGLEGMFNVSVSESANQLQSLIEGEDYTPPNDLKSLVERNWLMFLLGGASGYVKTPSGKFSPKAKPKGASAHLSDKALSVLEMQTPAVKSAMMDLIESRISRFQKKQVAKGATRGSKIKAGLEKRYFQKIRNKLDQGKELSESELVNLSQALGIETKLMGGKKNPTLSGAFLWDQALPAQRATALGVDEVKYPALAAKPQFPFDNKYSNEASLRISEMMEETPVDKTTGLMGLYDKARRMVNTEYAALGAAQRAAEARRGGRKLPLNLEHLAETHYNASQRGAAFVREFDRDVLDPVHNLGLSKEFDELILLQRILSRTKNGLSAERSLSVHKDYLSRINDEISQFSKIIKGEKDKDYDKYLEAIKSEKKHIEEVISSLKSKPDKKIIFALDADGKGGTKWWTEQEATLAINSLKNRLGNGNFNQLSKYLKKFEKHSNDTVKRALADGLIDVDTFKNITKDGDFYAPFVLEKYLTMNRYKNSLARNVVSPTFDLKNVQGISSLDDKITSPTEGLRNQINDRLIVGSENKIVKSVMEDLRAVKLVREIEDQSDIHSHLKEGEGYFSLLDNGKRVIYAVDQDVADSINLLSEANKGGNRGDAGWLMKGAGLGGKTMRALVTRFAPAFQIKNFLTDAGKNALLSETGLRANPLDWLNFVGRDYPLAMISAFKGQAGRPDRLYDLAAKTGTLGTSLKAEIDPNYIGKLKKHPSHSKPTAWSEDFVEAGKGRAATAKEKAGEWLSLVSDSLERTGKLVPLKRMLRQEGIDEADEAAVIRFFNQNPKKVYEIMRFSGSPLFSRGTKEMREGSRIIQFLNPAHQGFSTDMNRLTDFKSPEGRKAMARMGIVGTGAMGYYLNKVYSPELRPYYERIPEHTRNNGFIDFADPSDPDNYFVPSNEEGRDEPKKMLKYTSWPKRDIFRQFANVTESLYKDFVIDEVGGKEVAINAALAFGRDIPAIGDVVAAVETEKFGRAFSSLSPAVTTVLEREGSGDEDNRLANLYTGGKLLPYGHGKAKSPDLRTGRKVEPFYNQISAHLQRTGIPVLKNVGGADLKHIADKFSGGVISNFALSEHEEEFVKGHPVTKFLFGSMVPAHYVQTMSKATRDAAEKAIIASHEERMRDGLVAVRAAKGWFEERSGWDKGKLLFLGREIAEANFPTDETVERSERDRNEQKKTRFLRVIKSKTDGVDWRLPPEWRKIAGMERKVGVVREHISSMRKMGYTESEVADWFESLFQQKFFSNTDQTRIEVIGHLDTILLPASEER